MSIHIYDEIVNLLIDENNCNIGIAMHDSPDGDCVGSAIALEESLLQIGKNVTIICHNKVSSIYKDIFGINRVDKITITDDSYFDIIVLLDCCDVNRTVSGIESMCDNLIIIDHHDNCEPFGDIYLYEKSPSTGVILYNIIKKFAKITPEIATALYLTIRSDTGCFKNNNTSSIAHKTAGKLISHGADIQLINKIYDGKSLSFLKLMGNSFNEIIFERDYGIIYLIINYRSIRMSGSTYKEASNLIDLIKNVDGSDVAYLFLINKDKTIVKGRSSDNVDIAKIMTKFDGGGHKNAAGAIMSGSNHYDNIDRVIRATKECIDDKNRNN